MVSATRMTVSLKTDLRFPDTGHYGHGSRIIQPCFLYNGNRGVFYIQKLTLKLQKLTSILSKENI